jgi:hypothetical protein
MRENALSNRRSLLILLVWLLSAVYMGMDLKKGWGWSDEGTLGQTAERVLDGEIPHRDFADPYTGGLAFANAFLFKLFGINLFWLRVFLFVVFLCWVPAVYLLARQFLAPWSAGGATLVAVAWSVPNYNTPMPSWFNLFLATFGTLALAKYVRKPAIHWLLVAGLCGGCSFLIKSVALYYIAGALLFFVYREQTVSRNQPATPRRTHIYFAFLALCLGMLVLSLLKLVAGIGEIPQYLHFVFPGLAVAGLLIFRERTASTIPDWSRFKTLLGMALPFLVAAVFPYLLFCIIYWRRGALVALMNGLFVAPFRRLLSARLDPPGLLFEYPSVLASLFVIETANLRGRPRQVLSIILLALAMLVLLGARRNDLAYIIGITSARGIIPVLVLAAVLHVYLTSTFPCRDVASDQFLFLLLAMTAFCSLIQFPYSSLGYFFYVAPFAVLLSANLISRLARPPRVVLYAAAGFYILFAAFVTRPHYIGTVYHPAPEDTQLTFPRAGGIRVSRAAADEYHQVVSFVKDIAGNGRIYAGPDCPEIYFLSGIKNSTPVLFDSLEDPRKYESYMRAIIDRPNFLNVIVIRNLPNDAVEQLALLRSLVIPRFRNSRTIGRFTVYWRP